MKKINKLFTISTTLIFMNNALAIDIQPKFRNADKSSFEGISDYRILRKGTLQTSFSYSVLSNPLVNKNEKVGGLHEVDVSAVYGVNSFFELGVTAPFISTVVEKNSLINSYKGLTDLYIQGKINVFDFFSIVPVYVKTMNEGNYTTGTNEGGFGVNIVGGTELSKKINFHYTLGQFNFKNNIYGKLDQTQRTQVGLGLNYKINDQLLWGGEVLHDSMKDRKTTILLNHATVDFNSFKLRAGVTVGIGNKESQSNVGAFFTIISDFNVFGRKEKTTKMMKYDKVPDEVRKEVFFDQKDFESELDTVDQIEEDEDVQRNNNSVEVDNEKLKKELKDFIKSNKVNQSSEDDGMNGHSVLPFYTIEEVRIKETEQKNETINKVEKEIVNKTISRKELDIGDIQYLEIRETRIKETMRNLEYFLGMYKKDKITKEKVLKEINWSKKLLKMRRDSLDDFVAVVEKKYGKELDKKELTAFVDTTENETIAMNILKDEKETFNEMIKTEKQEPIGDSIASNNIVETEAQRAERLTREQSKVIKEGKTLSELKKEQRKKSGIVDPIYSNIETPSNLILAIEKESSIIEENQKPINLFEVSPDTVPLDLSKEGNQLDNKSIEHELLTIPEERALIPKFRVQLKDNSVLVNSTKNRIEELMNKDTKDIESSGYEAFYESYKNKIKEKRLKELKEIQIAQEKEDEEKRIIKEEMDRENAIITKEIVKKNNPSQNKDSGEIQIIQLRNFKVKSIEERYEELKSEIRKDNNQKNQEFNNSWENPSGLSIEEEGFLEKTNGPDY